MAKLFYRPFLGYLRCFSLLLSVSKNHDSKEFFVFCFLLYENQLEKPFELFINYLSGFLRNKLNYQHAELTIDRFATSTHSLQMNANLFYFPSPTFPFHIQSFSICGPSYRRPFGKTAALFAGKIPHTSHDYCHAATTATGGVTTTKWTIHSAVEM